jgi:hypothetical protein
MYEWDIQLTSKILSKELWPFTTLKHRIFYSYAKSYFPLNQQTEVSLQVFKIQIHTSCYKFSDLHHLYTSHDHSERYHIMESIK